MKQLSWIPPEPIDEPYAGHLARSTDPETSHEAARIASWHASDERVAEDIVRLMEWVGRTWISPEIEVELAPIHRSQRVRAGIALLVRDGRIRIVGRRKRRDGSGTSCREFVLDVEWNRKPKRKGNP